MAVGALQLDQALSTAVCAHICSSVTLGEHCRFDAVAESAIQGLADVLAAYIVEVGSSAQAEAELAGRAESNLVDVMLALQPRGEGELAPWAELLQMVQMPVPRLPANLLSGGPLSAVDIPPAAPKSKASLPARANLPAPLASAGREYHDAVGFLPALPARHTFMAADAPTMSVDPESSVNDHSAQRRRTAARRQIELNLCKLRAEAAAHDCLTSNRDGLQQVDNDGEDRASGTKTVVGGGAALHLSAMNERAARYAAEKRASGLWAHNELSPQTFLNNQALLAAARSARAPKRKREEDAAPRQRPRLKDAVQTQHSMKADSDDTAAESSAQKTSPSKPALVLGNSSETAAVASASASVASAPAPTDAAEESDDDKPLAPPKRPALTIGNKPRPSLTIKRAAPEGSAASSTVATTEALPKASPISSSPEQSPVVGTASGEDIPMSHPKLMGQCLKMLEEIKAHQSSWPFLAPVPEDTPGYSLYIKEKIDISTIEARLNARQYDSLAAFEAAFKLMYDNCDVYNDPTINPSGGVYLECSRKSRAKAEKRFGKIRKKLLDGAKKGDGAKARPQVQLKLSMK